MFSVTLVCLECVQTLSCMAPNSKNTILINHRKNTSSAMQKIEREKLRERRVSNERRSTDECCVRIRNNYVTVSK